MVGTRSGPAAGDPAEDEWRRWHLTGVVEVAPDVFRMPLPLPMDGLKAVNVYALRSDAGVTLIDAGWATEGGLEELERALGEIGVGLPDIREFLVTHIHRDHYSLATVVRKHFGTRVRLGIGEQVNVSAITDRPGQIRAGQVEALRRCGAAQLADRVAGQPAPTVSETRTSPDAWLDDGAHVTASGRRLRVVHTPGHTRGHVAFHDVEHELLFSGDHVLPHITPSIGFEAQPPESPLRDYLVSLHLVRGMPDARLLPGHGPVGESVHQRVDQLLEHHDGRLAATLDAVRRGAGTAYEVARLLTWTGRERQLGDLDDFNAMLAVLETSWHLEVLSERGRISRGEDGAGVVFYELLDAAAGGEVGSA